VIAILIAAALFEALSPAHLFSIFSPARGDAKKGAELHAQGKFRDAARRFGAAARRDPADPAWTLDLGTALGAAGERDKAQGPLAAAARSGDPRIAADALYQQGTLDLQEHKYGEAADALRRSLTLDPSRADAKRNYEIAFRNLTPPKSPPKPSPSPQPGANPPPPGRPPAGKAPGSDPEFEKRSGMTRREAEELLRSLDAEQRQREKTAAAVAGKDW
jgi:tetratricopeptide (TPR) repeat protein